MVVKSLSLGPFIAQVSIYLVSELRKITDKSAEKLLFPQSHIKIRPLDSFKSSCQIKFSILNHCKVSTQHSEIQFSQVSLMLTSYIPVPRIHKVGQSLQQMVLGRLDSPIQRKKMDSFLISYTKKQFRME